MKLTNPQLAELTKHMAQHYAFAGSIDLRHIFGIDPDSEVGDVDVRVYNDTEEIDSFQVDVLGNVAHYA